MAIKSLKNGAWEEIETLNVPVNGAMQEADHANALVEGAWQEVWSSGLPFTKTDEYGTPTNPNLWNVTYEPHGSYADFTLEGDWGGSNPLTVIITLGGSIPSTSNEYVPISFYLEIEEYDLDYTEHITVNLYNHFDTNVDQEYLGLKSTSSNYSATLRNTSAYNSERLEILIEASGDGSTKLKGRIKNLFINNEKYRFV